MKALIEELFKPLSGEELDDRLLRTFKEIEEFEKHYYEDSQFYRSYGGIYKFYMNHHDTSVNWYSMANLLDTGHSENEEMLEIYKAYLAWKKRK